MTPVNYLDLGPLLLLTLFGIAAPHISAYLTKAPGYLTGVLTTLVAAVGGFLAQWVEQDHGYDWKRGLYNTLLAWAVGLGVKNGWLKYTGIADRLHAKGPKLGDVPAGLRNDRGAVDVHPVVVGLFVVLVLVLVFAVKWWLIFLLALLLFLLV